MAHRNAECSNQGACDRETVRLFCVCGERVFMTVFEIGKMHVLPRVRGYGL
jgi:hypothetical protein